MTAFVIRVPEVTFRTRVQTDQAPGFTWKDTTSRQIFAGRRVAVFAVPGAFTPTCSSTHLPGYEMEYDKIRAQGVDEVYCLSVNDSFVMGAWFTTQDITRVKALPDGSGEFSRKMGMLVDKDNLGFGLRSWRYSMVVTDGVIEMMWVEPGLRDNHEGDPFVVSDAQTLLKYLEENPTVDSTNT